MDRNSPQLTPGSGIRRRIQSAFQSGRKVVCTSCLWAVVIAATFAHWPAWAHQPRAAATAAGPTPSSELPLDFGGAFSLVDHLGRRWTDRDFRGEFLIVYFGYTSCPFTCPAAVQNIAGAMDALGDDASRVRPLFVTVDPEYDTPERLAAYVRRIHPRMLGLTGSSVALDRMLSAYWVQAREVEESGGYERLFDHGPMGYLVGPDGEALTLLPPILSPDRMAEIVRGYM